MKSIENSEDLFQDEGDVEDFRATLGGKLRNVLRCNYGICHIQALLGEAITKESSQTEEALTSSIRVALGELDDRTVISAEMIGLLVHDALTEVLGDGSGEKIGADAGLSVDEMEGFGLIFSDDVRCSRDRSRGPRELSVGEELSF